MKNEVEILEDFIQAHADALDAVFRDYGIHNSVNPKTIVLAAHHPEIGEAFSNRVSKMFYPDDPAYSSADGKTASKFESLMNGASKILGGIGSVSGVFGRKNKKTVRATTEEPTTKQSQPPPTEPVEKKEKIMGMSKPMFIGVAAVVVLGIIWYVWKGRKG